MASYTDALRGYAHRVLRRDGFTCVYCGWDGSQWPNWLYLSWDHLLPKGHPDRDDERFIVTACRICNEFCNRTAFDVEGRPPEEIVALKKSAISSRRDEYHEFWQSKVATDRPLSAEDVDERQTAFHEAGHAVALYWHGLRTSTKRTFVQLSIEPDEETLGRMIHRGAGEWWNPEFGDDRRTIATTEVRIITSLAGRHAERRAGYEPFGYWSDFESASELVVYLAVSEKVMNAQLQLLDAVAEATFENSKVWSAVEALVEQLLEHRTLKWREARSVLQPILGPWKLPT